MALPSDYLDFLQPDCDRKEFIQKRLMDCGIKSSVLVIEGKNHIYVDFASSCYNPQYKLKTLVAHYDRVPGTQGANDNSSGVFALIEAAKKIAALDIIHNVRIIFTDGEEEGRFGVASQGAFSLAKKLKELNFDEGDMFVFDCIGRGDVPVICEIDLPPKVDKNFARKYQTLLSQTQNVVSRYSPLPNLVLPASFSDNAGFVANGIPAVAVTMLPKDEVINYMSNLKRIPGLRQSVMNRRLEDIPSKVAPEYILRESIPLTWRYIHTEYDKVTTLTPNSFNIISKIIDDIVRLNYLKPVM